MTNGTRSLCSGLADPVKIQSTFMNDLQQISLCLKQVTDRSLLLIDEFGKGTSESGL